MRPREAIDRYIEACSISRETLAQESDIPLEVLSGEKEWTPKMLRKLCKALNVSAHKFIRSSNGEWIVAEDKGTN